MSLLSKVLGSLRRQDPAVRRPPPSDRTVATSSAPALSADLSSPATLLLRLKQDLQTPCNSPSEALAIVSESGLPVLERCLELNDLKKACRVEGSIYDRLIKSFEDPDHYEACFRLIEEPLRKLGERRRAKNGAGAAFGREATRLLFLVHNLESDLAHVVLLCDVLESYLVSRPERAADLAIIGAVTAVPTERIRRLAEQFGVAVFMTAADDPAECYESCARMVDASRFDRVVVVAPPLGLSYLSGRLPAHAVAWWSLKFELGCFDSVGVRCSVASGYRETRVVRGRRWHRAPPLFSIDAKLSRSASPPQVLVEARRYGTVFYTVNREEKIKNPLFLELVADVLSAVENSCFVWTGRTQPPSVQEYFAARGLTERCFFAGWIVPDDLLIDGDVFLDTPALSGTMAARAASAGLPVVTLIDSQSWVNFFMHAFNKDRIESGNDELSESVTRLAALGLTLECSDKASYVSTAVRLATDSAARAAYCHALRTFAGRYFFRTSASAEEHLSNFCLANDVA